MSTEREDEMTPDAAVEAAVERYFVWRNQWRDPDTPYDGSEIEFVTEMFTVMLAAYEQVRPDRQDERARVVDSAAEALADVLVDYDVSTGQILREWRALLDDPAYAARAPEREAER
jgi:hypothetical protein